MPERGCVYIIDDDDGVRDSLKVLLETHNFTVVCFHDGEDFLRAVGSITLGCILLDIRLPKIDGLGVHRKLIERGIHLPVIMMTGYADVPLAVEAMRMGAVDFLEKPVAVDRMLGAVQRAIEMAVAQYDADAREQHAISLIENLSPRETQVFLELIKGHQNKEIGRMLSLSPRTIEVHRTHIYKKLEAANLADLVRIAISAGIDASENKHS